MNPQYKKLDEKAWLDFGKNLLDKNKLEEQKEFLEACKDKESFLNYLEEHLLTENNIDDGVDVNFNHLFTEEEFCNPTNDTQKIIWDQFKKLPHEIKMRCDFWGYIVINLIESDCIQSSYLAVTNGNGKGLPGDRDKGLSELDITLNKADEAITDDGTHSKKIDGCVRKVLRSMCNPAPRGKRIIFNDFPIGKSYWRWHWSDQMARLDDLGLTAEEIREVLDSNSYDIFSGKMHSGKSYISQQNLFGGLLLFLKEENNKVGPLRKLIDRLSYLSAWKGIELQSFNDNKEEIRNIQASLK